MTPEERRRFPRVMVASDLEPAPIIERDSAIGVSYLGYATLGTLTSEPKWKIVKVTETTVGTVTTTMTEYAKGTDEYEYVWDDRAVYKYSR